MGMRSWTLPLDSLLLTFRPLRQPCFPRPLCTTGLAAGFFFVACVWLMVPSGPATKLSPDLTFGFVLAGSGAVSGVPCLTNPFL